MEMKNLDLKKNKNKNADLVFMHLNWIMMIFAFKIIQ